jgi:arginyl-tRNA synthetase
MQADEAAKAQILESDAPPFIDEVPAQVNNVPTAKEKLMTAIAEATAKYLAAQNMDAGTAEIELETPHDPAHGDYAANIAMKLGKMSGRNPREVAEGIIQNLPRLDYVEKTEIAGLGFINFHLSTAFLAGELDLINRLKNNFGRSAVGAGKKVLIEYSAPNIAKPLGVHHLLSTIIGQTLVDLFRFGGYEVIALNYPGDWGTQFGKLLYAYKTWGDEETVKKDPLNELLKLYVRFHDEAEKDVALEDKGREEFKKLEEGDAQNKELWRWMKDLSIQEIERLYKVLGVHFDEYLGEQMYLEKARTIIEEGKARGIITTGEKGALIVQFEDEKMPPYMLQKSDGTTLYSTRDIASIKDRIERWHPDELIYVVDVAQSLHFKQLFEVAHKFGFTGPQYKHVIFGRMQMPEGPMSTRKGDVILLDEVIKEAVAHAEKLIAEKSKDLTDSEKEFIAREMAVSAIKYNIISQNRETNITFSWEKMLALDGNSGPYLQYACARAHSILRKAKEAAKDATTAAKPVPKMIKESNQTDLFTMTEEAEDVGAKSPAPHEENAVPFGNVAEKRLLRMLPRLPEYVELAIRDYKPNLLCNYLYDLARAFSAFYNEVPVLTAATEELKNSRLKIVQGVSNVLGNGLKVLGIAVFERM